MDVGAAIASNPLKQIGREYAAAVILGLATTVTSARSSPVDGGSQL